MKTYEKIIGGILIITLSISIFCISSPRVKWIKQKEKIVLSSTYDSLIAIANRPPQIIKDTIRDTITIKTPVIKWLKPDTIYLKGDTIPQQAVINQDTLATKYFKVFLTDTITQSAWIRSWTYEIYKEDFITIIEKEKPVIVYKDPDVSSYGLYGGLGYMHVFEDNYIITVDAAWLLKTDWMIQFRTGILFNKEEFNPFIGGSILKHF